MLENLVNKQAYTLYELTTQIKQEIFELYPDYIWVIGELAEISERKGHYYLTLIEKDPETGKTIAKVRANLWRSRVNNILGKFELITGKPLQEGMKILLLVSVEFHELYGFSLIVHDIDPNYTLGEHELIKRQTIEKLKKDGVFDLNKAIPFPLVPQRIAIISSDKAAGYQDFVTRLENNEYGFKFFYKLYNVFVQGERVQETIIKALHRIAENIQQFDVVVIIRGGGGREDLIAFDSYELAYTVANFPIPIITGIGHTKDQSVVDMVAHTALPTPTAVANFLIEKALNFYSEISNLINKLKSSTLIQLKQQSDTLYQIKNQLIAKTISLIQNQKTNLNIMQQNFPKIVLNYFQNQYKTLNEIASKFPQFALIPSQKRNELQNLKAKLEKAALNLISSQKNNLNILKQKLSTYQNILNNQKQQIKDLQKRLQFAISRDTQFKKSELNLIQSQLKFALNKLITQHLQNLKQMQIIIEQNDITRLLKKGYSITLHNGKTITNIDQIQQGEQIETILFKGRLISTVNKKISD